MNVTHINWSNNNMTSSTATFPGEPSATFGIVTSSLVTHLTRHGRVFPIPSKKEDLLLWRTTKELDLMPLVVINTLCMLIGVVGNSTVCYVCAVRMPRTVLNCFVLSLAIAELLGCVLIIPLETTKTMNAYNFDYPVLCKTEKYLRTFVIFFTNCVLIAIATERYQRIVKPHNKHVSMRQFQFTIVASVTFAAVAAIPEAVLAGSQSMKTKFGTVIVCSTYSSDAYSGTFFPPLWACFVVLVYVISTVTIGSIYCVIAVTIWKRGKLQTDRRSRPNTPDLTLRRRVQCLYSNNHPSIRYLPHHHSMSSAPNSEYNVEYPHGSLRRHGYGSVFRHNSDFGLLTDTGSSVDESQRASQGSAFRHYSDCGVLTAPTSPTDDFNIKVEVHRSEKSANSEQNGQEEEYKDSPSPLFPNNTSVSRFLFEGHHYDFQNELQRGDHHQYRQNRESTNSECSVRSHARISGSADPTLNDFQLDSHSLRHFNSEKDRHTEHQQLKPEPRRKERRRFTAVFFDELYQTVSRRRQRQEAEFFDRQSSTEDILTPPSLSPMGSIRSRSGYSRKRTTFIMFVMTTTTAISLFPHMIVLLYRLAHPTVELRLSPDDSVVFYVAWNSFFISLACHPYVYGFWNGRFKKALISLFDGLREKTKRRRLATREDEFKDNSRAI